VFDAHRTDLARFFTAHSTLVWEGMVVGGQQYCAKLFEMLPPSKHTIATFDVHPVTGGAEMRGAVNTLLVNVTGTVHWGMAGSEMAATAQGFYHSFVLERSQSSSGGKSVHHIISASIRTRQVDEQQTYAGGDSAPRPRKRMSYQNR
jgi:hypothetical protein